VEVALGKKTLRLTDLLSCVLGRKRTYSAFSKNPWGEWFEQIADAICSGWHFNDSQALLLRRRCFFIV